MRMEKKAAESALEAECANQRIACLCAQLLSGVQLFATPWTVSCQVPLSMGFSWQEHWSVLPFPPPGDLPDPRIKPSSPTSPGLQVDSFTTEPPWRLPTGD